MGSSWKWPSIIDISRRQISQSTFIMAMRPYEIKENAKCQMQTKKRKFKNE